MANNNSDDKLWAFLSILLNGLFIPLGFILAYAMYKEKKYIMYYAKQGLMLYIIGFVVGVVGFILGMIPIIQCIAPLVIGLAGLGIFALAIIGMVYSFSGEMKEIPLVSKLTDQFLKQL